MMDTAFLESHSRWWGDAGVTNYVAEHPLPWLKADTDLSVGKAVPFADQPFPTQRSDSNELDGRIARASEASNSASAAENSALQAPSMPDDAQNGWPSAFEDLNRYLLERDDYPGAGFSRRRVASVGPKQAKLTIVTDMPSETDLQYGELLGGDEGRLLDAMLSAIGLSRMDCHLMPLATSRPASGEIDPEDWRPIGRFALHRLALAEAGTTLCLGNSASTVLVGGELFDKRGRSHKINHNGGSMAISVCLHPRTLLARPALKAAAWQDLQTLKKDLEP